MQQLRRSRLSDRGGSAPSIVCRTRYASVAALVVLLAASVRMAPGPQLNAGSLDPRFETDGKVVTDFRVPISSEGQAVAVQPDGKTVVAGTVENASGRRFGLTRYNTDGTLDQSFGAGGMIITTFAERSQESVAALALQTDGKIIVAGTTTFREFDFAIARYKADGTLDSALAMQPDGDIVLVGSQNRDFAVAKYLGTTRAVPVP